MSRYGGDWHDLDISGAFSALDDVDERLARIERALCICHKLKNSPTEIVSFYCPIHPEKRIPPLANGEAT